MSNLTPESVGAQLKEKFGAGILADEMLQDFYTVTVDQKVVYDVVKYLHDVPTLNFHFLTTMCGLHYPDSDKPFGLMIQLHNMPANFRIRLKTFTGDAEPRFKTFTTIYPAANWMEREAFDFFGFRFDGHPDLRRIVNMDSMEGWPMRKEYPLEDQFRRDKDDKMFGR